MPCYSGRSGRDRQRPRCNLHALTLTRRVRQTYFPSPIWGNQRLSGGGMPCPVPLCWERSCSLWPGCPGVRRRRGSSIPTGTKVVVAVPDNTNTWPFYYRDEATRAASEYDPRPGPGRRHRGSRSASRRPIRQDMTRRDIGEQGQARSARSSARPTRHPCRTSTSTTWSSSRAAPWQFTQQNRAGCRAAGPRRGAGDAGRRDRRPEGRMPVPHNPPPVGHTPQTDLPATRITAPPR